MISVSKRSLKPKITIVVGTRPEIIRFAPVIKELDELQTAHVSLIHTGQHYSHEMSQVFFDELGVKKPDANLEVGSRDSASQVGETIIRCSEVFRQQTPELVCVWGDTNSSLGAAIAANKMKIWLAHIEAGCRSFDTRMAEEYNRIVIDHIADLLFPLSNSDSNNLERERVTGRVYQMGDPLLDVYKKTIRNLKYRGLAEKYALGSRYGIFTLHRAENTDDKKILRRILEKVGNIRDYKIVFPAHPRTLKMMEEYNITRLIHRDTFVVVPPLGYLEIMELLRDSTFVITDSGGFQKEAFFASKPCITLRKSTEWRDTVNLGVNILIDPESDFSLTPHISKIPTINIRFSKILTHPYGNGNASKKIAETLVSYCLNIGRKA